jgi:uncharacterized membrane protein
LEKEHKGFFSFSPFVKQKPHFLFLLNNLNIPCTLLVQLYISFSFTHARQHTKMKNTWQTSRGLSLLYIFLISLLLLKHALAQTVTRNGIDRLPSKLFYFKDSEVRLLQKKRERDKQEGLAFLSV